MPHGFGNEGPTRRRGRKGAADPHAVEKLTHLVTRRREREPAVLPVAAAVRDARRAGSVTLGNLGARWVTMRDTDGPRGQWDWWVARSERSRTTRVGDQCLADRARLVAESHAWFRWNGTIRAMVRPRAPQGQGRVRATTDRPDEGRRQDGCWNFVASC